ncbi:hypothetical protein [Chlamydia sp.]|uniref:hypothetical protein n=1 Tax=Chlamydia sp. TaxID=35827 RepID=UPI0025B9736A|nr:hypothetical protein [Chlamydia sp.]
MKTSTGEVTLSQSIEEGNNEALISALGIANICTAQEELPAPIFQHNLVFLTPETVELEIQISDLLQALEEAPSSTTSSQKGSDSLARAKPAAKVSIFSLQAKESSQSDSSQASQQPAASQQLARPFTLQDQPTRFPTPERNVSRIPSSVVPHRRANPASSEHSFTGTSRSHQTNLSTGTLLSPSQKEWELPLQMARSCSTQKEKQEGQQEKNSHQEHSNEDSHQEKKEHEADAKVLPKKKQIKEGSLGHENDEIFSVSHLAYNLGSHPSLAFDQEPCQSTFQKRPPSPMSLFSSQNSVEETSKKPEVENVFLRFMRLMARILGQAEAEAHELYLRVKERTDNVDALTLLLSNINNEKGAINWSQNAEMQALVDQAKKLGVAIGDSYTWSEDEKKLLKENIQMRKENMEKITQLERTDMQRHLQEVSQCHQARSNVLKLLKELMDTFIYNMRP